MVQGKWKKTQCINVKKFSQNIEVTLCVRVYTQRFTKQPTLHTPYTQIARLVVVQINYTCDLLVLIMERSSLKLTVSFKLLAVLSTTKLSSRGSELNANMMQGGGERIYFFDKKCSLRHNSLRSILLNFIKGYFVYAVRASSPCCRNRFVFSLLISSIYMLYPTRSVSLKLSFLLPHSCKHLICSFKCMFVIVFPQFQTMLTKLQFLRLVRMIFSPFDSLEIRQPMLQYKFYLHHITIDNNSYKYNMYTISIFQKECPMLNRWNLYRFAIIDELMLIGGENVI